MIDHPSPTVIALRREPGGLVRSLTSLLLRLALGMLFLTAGWQKLEARKAGEYPGGMVKSFEGTILAERMPGALDLFAQTLPFAEVGLGALLILGLATTLSAFATGLLLLSLLFGLLLLAQTSGDMGKIPTHMIYVLMDAAILWLSPVSSNYLSVDGLFFGWFWKPRAIRYQVEPEHPSGRI
jgi:thiosulfate dehydrogenase [quinone] large subunit